MQETLPKRVPYLSPHVTYPWRTSAKKGPSNRWIFSGWTVKSLPYYSTYTRCYIHLWTTKTGTRINSRWPFIPFHIFKLLTHHTPHTTRTPPEADHSVLPSTLFMGLVDLLFWPFAILFFLLLAFSLCFSSSLFFASSLNMQVR